MTTTNMLLSSGALTDTRRHRREWSKWHTLWIVDGVLLLALAMMI
jgi:hypothetical protein